MKNLLLTLLVTLAGLSTDSKPFHLTSKTDPVGIWTGKIGPTRVAIEIEKDQLGKLTATFYNLDGRVVPFKAKANIEGDTGYSMEFPDIARIFQGDFNLAGDSLLLEMLMPNQNYPVPLTKSEYVQEIEKRKNFNLPKGMNSQAPMELADWAFLAGEWHGKHKKKLGRGREGDFLLVWIGEWILNGNVMKNTSQTWALGPDGKKGGITQHGMDIRTWNTQTKVFDHSYTDALSGKINKMTWKRVGDEIHSDPSEWMDYEGYNMNIIKFKNITDDHFTWAVDRSFDKGKTWKENYVVIENIRVK